MRLLWRSSNSIRSCMSTTIKTFPNSHRNSSKGTQSMYSRYYPWIPPSSFLLPHLFPHPKALSERKKTLPFRLGQSSLSPLMTFCPVKRSIPRLKRLMLRSKRESHSLINSKEFPKSVMKKAKIPILKWTKFLKEARSHLTRIGSPTTMSQASQKWLSTQIQRLGSSVD